MANKKNFMEIWGKIQNLRQIREQDSIFKRISNTNYHENYHSDILAYLLARNNNAKTFIDCIFGNKVSFNGFEECKVFREKCKIDILICTDKNAIIIESKSNNSSDRERQIPRYVRDVENSLNLKVCGVVYLTLLNGNQPNKFGWLPEEIERIDSLMECVRMVDDKIFSNKAIALNKEWKKRLTNINDNEEETRVIAKEFFNHMEEIAMENSLSEAEKELLKFVCEDGGYSKIKEIKQFIEHKGYQKIIARSFREYYLEQYKNDDVKLCKPLEIYQKIIVPLDFIEIGEEKKCCIDIVCESDKVLVQFFVKDTNNRDFDKPINVIKQIFENLGYEVSDFKEWNKKDEHRLYKEFKYEGSEILSDVKNVINEFFELLRGRD